MPAAKPRYEIDEIKISISPENRKFDFFKLFQRPKKCSMCIFAVLDFRGIAISRTVALTLLIILTGNSQYVCLTSNSNFYKYDKTITTFVFLKLFSVSICEQILGMSVDII